MATRSSLLIRIRIVVAIAIIGLVISGLTAFPLLWELKLLSSWFESGFLSEIAGGRLADWIHKVRDGLENTYRDYPFIPYGTDWLAFGHLVIALFFLPLWKDPVRYQAIFLIGMVACLGVIPLALICGPIRGIPFFWQLIDCSFGLICLPFLWWGYRQTRELENLEAELESHLS